MKCSPCKWIIEKKAYGNYLPNYIPTVLEEHLNPTDRGFSNSDKQMLKTLLNIF